nr:TadE/TadG family type IV pilus assembly protein [Vibrio vulnificus]
MKGHKGHKGQIGSVSVEAALIMPVLLALVVLFLKWDGCSGIFLRLTMRFSKRGAQLN